MTITFHYLNFKSQIHLYITISHSKLVQYISSSMKHAPAFLFFFYVDCENENLPQCIGNHHDICQKPNEYSSK